MKNNWEAVERVKSLSQKHEDLSFIPRSYINNNSSSMLLHTGKMEAGVALGLTGSLASFASSRPGRDPSQKASE